MPAGSAQLEKKDVANAPVKKCGRELWEEEQEKLRAEQQEAVAPLVMGTAKMCEVGGCGYFSDDGK